MKSVEDIITLFHKQFSAWGAPIDRNFKGFNQLISEALQEAYDEGYQAAKENSNEYQAETEAIRQLNKIKGE